MAQICSHLAHRDAHHVFDALPTWFSCMDAARPLPCRVPSPPYGRLAASPRALGRCGRPGSLSPFHPCLAVARGRAPPWPSLASLRPRCSALPLSKPSVPSPSSHHAAPLDLLYRRLWPLMLPAVGAAAVAAAATVAAPPQAASGQAGQPSVCARDPWSSPPLHRRHRRPQPAGAASRPLLCSTVGRKKKKDHAHE